MTTKRVRVIIEISEERKKMKKTIQIGIGDSTSTAQGFIQAWKRGEKGERSKAEQRLVFENLETLLKTLTQGR
jgi:predicted transcriptional regulator